MKGEYTLIVPALDQTGPVNLAVDIGMAAQSSGWQVCLLYLTPTVPREDLGFAHEVRQFRLTDLWRLRGVVHTHCLRPDLLGLILTWNARITLITTLHNFFLFDVGFDTPRLYVQIAWKIWQRALRGFDQVICISETMQRYYRRSLPGQELRMAYNFRAEQLAMPADPATLAWIESRRRAGNTVLTFVGSLSKRKNILDLVGALADAPSLSLIVCGQGPVREAIDEIVQSRGLQDRVRLQGQVLSPSSITRHTDALVLPSHTEGFPLAVLEAASVGVPALMSNITVHRELARLGFGQTFNHRCFSDLVQKAQVLRLGTPAPSAALIELWSKNFTPQAGFSRYEKLISEARSNAR